MAESGVGASRPTRLQYNNLTFARFVAAAMVLVHHAAPSMAQSNGVRPTGLIQVLSNGYAAVTFFFILSGFVISSAAFEALCRPTRAAVVTFYLRRVIRLVPVWLFLSLPLIFGRDSSAGLLQFLTFTQAWSPDVSVAFGYLDVSWTLSCEMFFYAIFPIAAFGLGALRQRFPGIGVWLVAACLAATFALTLWFRLSPTRNTVDSSAANGAHRWLYRMPIVRVSEFLLGIGLYLCFQRFRHVVTTPRARTVMIGVLGVSIAALLILMSTVRISTMTLSFAYMVPFTAIVFALASLDANSRPLSVRAPILLLLGEASYALYLVHAQYGLPLMHHVFAPTFSLAELVWGSTFVVVMSIGLYQLVEHPSRALLNRGIGRLATRL